MSLNRKHWFAVLGTAAAALAVVGCGEAAEEGSPPIMIDPTQVVKFQADASLQDVQDVAPSTTGEVWVLQREAAPHLFIYSEEGRLQDSFGMSGPARTQMSNPFWLVPTGDSPRPMAVWAPTYTGISRGNRSDGHCRWHGLATAICSWIIRTDCR
jgi:hypothetical protein